MRKVILLFILTIYAISFSSWARKPAIEPQMEVINEFKPLAPNVAKGYTFQENVGRTPNAITTPRKTTSTVSATSLITIVILGIPLFIWGAIAWRSRKLINSNVIPLPQKKDHDDPEDWKQAS